MLSRYAGTTFRLLNSFLLEPAIPVVAYSYAYIGREDTRPLPTNGTECGIAGHDNIKDQIKRDFSRLAGIVTMTELLISEFGSVSLAVESIRHLSWEKQGVIFTNLLVNISALGYIGLTIGDDKHMLAQGITGVIGVYAGNAAKELMKFWGKKTVVTYDSLYAENETFNEESTLRI